MIIDNNECFDKKNVLEDTDVVIISVGNGMNTDDDEKKSYEFVDKKIDTDRKLGMFWYV